MYILALNGYKPLVIERGKTVDERIRDVEEFWNTGKLNPSSRSTWQATCACCTPPSISNRSGDSAKPSSAAI